MPQWIGSALVQIITCRLFGAKPLSEPMLEYCPLDRWEQNSVEFWSKFKHFHSAKCIWICRLRNGGHFVSASMCWFGWSQSRSGKQVTRYMYKAGIFPRCQTYMFTWCPRSFWKLHMAHGSRDTCVYGTKPNVDSRWVNMKRWKCGLFSLLYRTNKQISQDINTQLVFLPHSTPLSLRMHLWVTIIRVEIWDNQNIFVNTIKRFDLMMPLSVGGWSGEIRSIWYVISWCFI